MTQYDYELGRHSVRTQIKHIWCLTIKDLGPSNLGSYATLRSTCGSSSRYDAQQRPRKLPANSHKRKFTVRPNRLGAKGIVTTDYPQEETIGMDSGKTGIATEPLNLKELVAYQDGAIVSRTLVSKDVGTVTLFAFDLDQTLSEHTAPYDALVIVIEGSVKIKISGREVLLDEGQMIIMPANQPHALEAVTRFQMILIMIREK